MARPDGHFKDWLKGGEGRRRKDDDVGGVVVEG